VIWRSSIEGAHPPLTFPNQPREAIPQRDSTPFSTPYGATLTARSTKQFGTQDAKIFYRWCSRVGVLTF
jgi:hypothetical protein